MSTSKNVKRVARTEVFIVLKAMNITRSPVLGFTLAEGCQWAIFSNDATGLVGKVPIDGD